MPTFSSKQYGWNDISIAIGGRILEGVTEFEYTAKQEKDILRGRGSKGHRILRGNKAYEGKLVLWQSEVEAMIADSPNKDILDLEFSIIYTYAPEEGGQSVTDIVPVAEVLEYKKGMKQGDKNMLVELPVIFYDIKNQQ
jgi:hypothetical protein